MGEPNRSHSRWLQRHNVGLWVGFLVATIAAIAIAAFVVAGRFWVGAAGAEPESRRDLEVIKTCLQVIAVGAVAAIVSVLAGTVQSAREGRADREQTRRETFEIRAGLLGRAARCAHAMYLHCQRALREMNDTQAPTLSAASRKQLDKAYHEVFAPEARALETEIIARYREELTTAPKSAETADKVESAGESFWRWHQVCDLITVYYFSLTRDFRSGNVILRDNSLGYVEEGMEGMPTYSTFHSGLDLIGIAVKELRKGNEVNGDAASKAAHPTTGETPAEQLDKAELDPRAHKRVYQAVEEAVRKEYPASLSRCADALMMLTRPR